MNTAYETVVQKQQRGDWKSMSQQERLDAICSFVTHLQSFAPISNRPCLGLAVVDSGVIDPQTGTSLQATTLDHWSNVPIVATLEKQLGLPVMLVNGSQACLRVIDRLELQSAIDDLLYIQYTEGIGCSIKSGGHYIAGYSSMAGEFGHCKVTDNDMPCRCGEIGCLEAVAALPALVREVKISMTQGCASTLGKQTHFDGHDVLKAASEGDRLACRVVHKAFSHLASAVGGLINILAPTVVLFDHCVGVAGEDLVSALLLETQRHALPSHSPHLDVRVSQIETEIISCGGAVALLDTCLEY